MIYKFNIKKYYMEKDIDSKQWHIKSLETRNIILNQSRNEKDDEIYQQSKIIKSLKEECHRYKDKITKLGELLNEKEKDQLNKKTMYKSDEYCILKEIQMKKIFGDN